MWTTSPTFLKGSDMLQPPIFADHSGRVAEWLGTALQKLLLRFESARDLREVPTTMGAFSLPPVPCPYRSRPRRVVSIALIPVHVREPYSVPLSDRADPDVRCTLPVPTSHW